MSAISDVLIIQDRVSDSMKHISQAMNETNSSTEKLKGGFSSLQAGIVTLSSTFQLIGQVKNFIMGAVSAMDKYISATQVQTQAEDKLAIVTKQRMGLTDDEVQSLYDLASAQQKVGVVGDEVAMAGMGLIARYTKQKASIEALTPALNNLAVSQYGYNVTAESMNSIGRMLGMAMQGQTMMLKRLGVNIDDNKKKWLMSLPEQQRAVELAKMITAVTGDMNEEFAKTPFGQITQGNNRIGDSFEQIGQILLPLKAAFVSVYANMIENTVNTLTKIRDVVAANINPIAQVITVALAAIGTYATATMVKNIIAASMSSLAWLKGLPELLRYQFALIKMGVSSLFAGDMSFKAGLKAAAGWTLANLPMVASIAIVGALIFAFVKMHKTVKQVLDFCIDKFFDFAQSALKAVRSVAAAIDSVFKSNLAATVDKLSTASENARKAAKGGTEKLQNWLDKTSKTDFTAKMTMGKAPSINMGIDKFAEGGALKTKQQGKIELKEEDIQMLNDLATRDWSVRSQLLAPNVNFGNVTVNENADVSQLVQEFANGVNEVAERSLEVGIGK